MKNILLVATGGTIASQKTDEGLEPSIDVRQILSYIPEAEKICRLSGTSIMSIDSTNMNPALMVKIAEAVRDNYESYDGFVITHGTDTMGYTAAALTYMLRHIAKPVVITGSQLSIEEPNTDAIKNLSDAIAFACEDTCGIFVAFGGKIISGTHAVKIKTKSTDAFASINFPDVASVQSWHVIYNNGLSEMPAPQQVPLKIQTKLCGDIFILKIFPGIKPDIFDFIKSHYKGVIIESFGIGGIPNTGYDIVSKIQELIEADIAVVITTQCMYEGINLNIYAVGKLLAQHNIIYAGDMTTEALTMKLMWALGNCNDTLEIKKCIETPFCADRNY